LYSCLLDLFPPLLEAAELCGADRPRCGQLPAEMRRAEQGRTAGARSKGRRRRGLELGHGGATAARRRPSRGAATGGRRAHCGGAGARRAASALRVARGSRGGSIPFLSLPLCLAEEEELQRRAVRRSAASSHRAAEPPVKLPRRRSACATGPPPTRRAAVEKNGGGGAAKSTCPTSTCAEPPRRCACCPAPCPRTNPTTREFQLPISSDRSNSPSTAVVIKNWLGTIWFYR